jgi:hypothetical protein
MVKILTITLILLFLSTYHATSFASNERYAKKYFREVCGFRFAKINGIKITRHQISTDSLRNRIDNERYNACPYKIRVSYLGLVLDLGFGQDVALDAISRWDEYLGLNTGVFEYGRDGWVAPFDNPTIPQSDINVKKSRDGVVVSGIFSRKGSPPIKSDYCFGLSAVGKDGFLTAMECRPTRRELQPINDLFKNAVVISFPRSVPSGSKNAKSDLCGSTSDCVY